MSTTAQLVHNDLPLPASLLTDTSKTVRGLNAAIAGAWPQIRLDEYAPSVATLADGTFTYSMAAVTGLDDERSIIGRVYIAEDSNQTEVGHREVRQYFDHGARAWYLDFAPSLVATWQGKAVNIRYQRPHPRITAISDTIYLPHNYLVARTAVWYADMGLTEQTIDPGRWQALRREWMIEAEQSLRANQSAALTPLMLTGADRMSA